MAPEHPSEEGSSVRHELVMLTRALASDLRSHLNLAIANMELLAFTLGWFSEVSRRYAPSLLC
jgi:hypothetical protein